MTVVPVPTAREPDGLALSSRNVYLSSEERRAATVLWRALQAAERLWERGERRPEALRNAMRALIEIESLARVDYVSVADPETLQELRRADGDAFASLALRLGSVRLIDNLLLRGDERPAGGEQ